MSKIFWSTSRQIIARSYTYSATSFLKTTKPSNLISTINDIRLGYFASTCPRPRPRLQWVLYKEKLTPKTSETSKFVLIITFSTSLQKEEIIPNLKKRFVLDKSNHLPASKIEISPLENGEDDKVILEELLKTACKRRIGSPSGGKSLLRDTVGGEKKTIIVEFGSPNIAKPLHMGHLRSTVTGHYVARICKAAGHNVVTMCFLGDWGTQFGLLQAGLAHWLPGDSVKKVINTLDLDSLLQYYIRAVKEQEINQIFAQEARKFSASLEMQDTSTVEVWTAIREKTLMHLKNVWQQLGIHYDVIQGESEFATHSDQTKEALEILRENGLSEIRDGCTYGVLPLSQRRQSQNAIVPLVKADGSSLYLLRDIAAALNRQAKFGFDQMIYVVDKGQSNHFLNLFSLLFEIGFATSIVETTDKAERKLRHVSFGKVEGMSTRSGNFVLFSDVIRDGSKIMEENRLKSQNVRNKSDNNISTQLALSSLIAHFLRIRRNRDCNFEWKEALRPSGDTGTRLQYTHSRLKSLEDKQEFKACENVGTELNVEYIFNDPIALDLALHLINFEDAFLASYDEFEASILLTYMFKLCDKISKALKELKVLGESNTSIANTRLILFALSRRTLVLCLDIIGIEPLDEI